jgi:hypothetical protein
VWPPCQNFEESGLRKNSDGFLSCTQIRLSSPFLSETELDDLAADPVLNAVRLPAFFDASGDAAGSLKKGLDALCEAADKAVKGGAELLILSDRDDNLVSKFSNTGNDLMTYQLKRQLFCLKYLNGARYVK